MLPYHLRPPIYGGKWKKKQKLQEATTQQQCADIESRSHPYHGGGPFQRAIRNDLEGLWPTFLQELTNATTPQNCPCPSTFAATTNAATCNMKSCCYHNHVCKGIAFGAAKRVLGQAKVALIQTRWVPSRVDRAAFSQLTYAAALQLLQSAFDDDDNDTSMKATSLHQQEKNIGNIEQETAFVTRAGYAVFCLYVLYETNPLPTGPEENKSIASRISMLSLGLVDRLNPKQIYRRNFKSPIRIDMQHFSHLIRLRNCARMVMAQCQQATHLDAAACGTTDLSSVTTTETMTILAVNDDDGKWNGCFCSMAQDVDAVTERLLQRLEFCAYTGPCSLEGLAGHPNYPYANAWNPHPRRPSSAVTAAAMMKDHPSTTVADVTCLLIDNASHDDANRCLAEHLQDYFSSRQSIRLPPLPKSVSQPNKQIRNALVSILVTHEGSNNSTSVALDPLLRLDAYCQGRDFPSESSKKKVTFHSSTLGALFVGGDDDGSKLDESRQVDPNDTHSHTGHQSVLSVGSSNAAVDITYELALPDGLTELQQESLSMAFQTLLDRDEMLLLSLAESNNPNAQQQQQQAMDTADISTMGDRGVSIASTTGTGAGRKALQALLHQAQQLNHHHHRRKPHGADRNQMRMGDLFLATSDGSDSNNDQGRDNDNGNVSDLSSDDDDEMTAAFSAVGRNALRDLLASSHTKPASAPGNKRKRTQPTNQEDQSVAVSNVGRSALNQLLSTVTAPGRPLQQQERQQPNRPRQQRQKTATAADRDDVSAVTSNVGRKALQSLLSAVAPSKPATVGASHANEDDAADDGIIEAGIMRTSDNTYPGSGSLSRNLDRAAPATLVNSPDGDEEESVPVSHAGRQALHALLSLAHVEEEEDQLLQQHRTMTEHENRIDPKGEFILLGSDRETYQNELTPTAEITDHQQGTATAKPSRKWAVRQQRVRERKRGQKLNTNSNKLEEQPTSDEVESDTSSYDDNETEDGSSASADEDWGSSALMTLISKARQKH